MKYNLHVASIAKQSESIEQKHDAFVKGTQGLPAPWSASTEKKAPDPGSNLSADIRASALLGKNLRGFVSYQFRRPFRDHASQDDYMYIDFNPAKIDYRDLIDTVFLQYVSAFDAYHAEIFDDKFINMDFDRIRELRVDARHGIYRLSPVTYVRKDLCQKAFGLSPRQIVERLQGKTESVREALDGVFIVLTSEVLPAEIMDPICWTAKSYL